MVKYIVVTGGVISGVGKGLATSSLGAMLKAHGVNVTSIKIDPYLNVDAGTFSPLEHGIIKSEVYVLDDGTEVDLDLGNYERFLDLCLTSSNNITTGKVYSEVISNERKGHYLGKTVQVVPHITDSIKNWIKKVANEKAETEVCLIELGGVIGDIESAPFVEALRQLSFEVGKNEFFLVHVSLLPMNNGELKTKPTQMSMKELRGLGLVPNMLICRTKYELPDDKRAKLQCYCQLPPSNIIELIDCDCIYEIPLKLFQKNACEILNESLSLGIKNIDINRLTVWSSLLDAWKNSKDTVNIALVGKYINLKDSYHSVIRALRHACLKQNLNLNLIPIDSEHLELPASDPLFHEAMSNLKSAHGIVIPGGFGTRGVEGKLATAKYARLNGVPLLGICFGFQIMIIEACRNILGIADATSEEFDTGSGNQVIKSMSDYDSNMKGGTMRLGSFPVHFVRKDSILLDLYGDSIIHERHRHRYEANLDYIANLEKHGMKFVAKNKDTNRMEIIELSDHPYYVGVQFHPEFKSKPFHNSPPFVGLITEAFARKNR